MGIKKNDQAEATRKAAVETEERVAAATGAKALTQSEIDAARKEGAKEDIKETAKDQHRALTDGNLVGDPPSGPQYLGMDDIMRFEPLLSLGVAEFEEAIADKPRDVTAVPEEKVAGLLSLERAGQNRTPYVQALCKRLGVKSPYEVTNAGPGFTNDVTPITEIARP